MECPPCCRGTRQKTYCHEEAKEIWEWILQLQGLFFLVLLALVDAEYRFLWVDVGSSGSSSGAQIFNNSKLRKKIEDGTLGLPPPEPLGEGGPDLHYFLLGDNAFALIPWMVKPYSKRQLTREGRIANYRIFRGMRMVENALEYY